MSLGYGVGDLLAVGTLALKLYVSYREGPREFKELSREILSLHTTLDELQTSAETPGSILSRANSRKIAKLESLVEGSREALKELEEIYEKYRRLEGPGKKISWTRLKFGKEDLDGIRHKLGTHLEAITVFLTTVSHDALGRMETKMESMHRIEAKVDQFYAELAEMKELLRGQAEARVNEGAATDAETLEREQAALSLCRPHDFHTPNTELVDPGGDISDIISVLQYDISSEEVDSNFDFISALVLWRGTSTALIPVARSASPKPQTRSPSGYGPSVSGYDHASKHQLPLGHRHRSRSRSRERQATVEEASDSDLDGSSYDMREYETSQYSHGREYSWLQAVPQQPDNSYGAASSAGGQYARAFDGNQSETPIIDTDWDYYTRARVPSSSFDDPRLMGAWYNVADTARSMRRSPQRLPTPHGHRQPVLRQRQEMDAISTTAIRGDSPGPGARI